VKDTYNGSTVALDGGTFALNPEAYAEDQSIMLGGGTHNISISYGGDKSYNSSTTNATFTVNKATTTIALSGSTQGVVGSPVTFSATLNSQVNLPSNAPTSDFPADNVQFLDGSTPISGTVTYQTAQPGTNEPLVTATLTTSALTAGSHTITAKFQGDANYSAVGPSNALTLSNLISTSGSTLTASAPSSQYGTLVTFTYTVTPSQTGSVAPTGEVYFSCSCSLETSRTLTSGPVQWVVYLNGGTDVITAQYSGDSNYAASSQSTTVTVSTVPSTTTLTTSNASIGSGASVTLTAVVAPSKSNSAQAPSGTVQFSAGTTSSGGSTNLGSANLSNGTAILTTSTIPSGTQFVFASYAGDSNYTASSASTAEAVTGGPASVTLAGLPATISIIAPGASGSTTLAITGVGGYSGTISLSAASCSGLPAKSSCSFAPASVTLSSASPTASTTMTIQTTAATTGLMPAIGRVDRFRLWPVGVLALFAALLLGAMFTAPQRVPRFRTAALTALLLGTLVTFVSCGGGGGGGGGGSTGTPTGTYTVMVSASAPGVTTAPSTSVTLTVQ
jgi:large repetitive protein